ncbi:DUF2617 family protein [Streptomyces radicis]|uniref:DUF2617 family protein n=1 Tax=Streptomyces radicis TaxID=1750517 RepID=A0A3A9WF64_9ACTN|nr:DUF2617 family protein [Streptomyces radicis]RKN25998.1 DUF2617 family protein [Streptomyces radicis]
MLPCHTQRRNHRGTSGGGVELAAERGGVGVGGIRLATPYLDTSAEQLSFAIGLPARPALAVSRIELGGVSLELRLLGASHQVFAGPVAETLACLPGEPGGGPPPSVERDVEGWRYRFGSRVHRHAPEAFAAEAARLRRATADRPGALCGVFPGSPHAITALTARREADVIIWQTWHAYPQTGQIVETRTRLEGP